MQVFAPNRAAFYLVQVSGTRKKKAWHVLQKVSSTRFLSVPLLVVYTLQVGHQ